MRNSDYIKMLSSIFDKIIEITTVKANDYASSGDTLKNFKVVGSRINIKASEVAWFFITVKLARLENLKDKPPMAESVEDTIIDLINYIGLYQACRLEEESTNGY